MNLETLYKRSVTGKILYWKISIKGITNHVTGYRLKYEHGELNTENPTISYSDQIFGKNHGKSNQTSDETQAYKDACSAWNRQIKKGYKTLHQIEELTKTYNYNRVHGFNIYEYLEKYLPEYNTDSSNSVKPMKAQKFELGKMNYPAICQPKINGCRCVIMYENIGFIPNDLFDDGSTSYCAKIKSKEGDEYHVDHIQKIFSKFYEDYPEYRYIVFDGELYKKGEFVANISGAARNPKNKIHKDLQFVCFDLSIPDLSNGARDKIRFEICELLWTTNEIVPTLQHNKFNKYSDTKIIFLDGIVIYNDNEAVNTSENYINDGFEGGIIRDLTAEYKFGSRAKTMRKLKRFIKEEFEVLDIISTGSPIEKVGFSVKCICKNNIADNTFESTLMGDVDERLEILNNKDLYIGKKALIKFYERTNLQKPFHSNVIEIK